MSDDDRPDDATEPGFRLNLNEEGDSPTGRLPRGAVLLDLDVEGRTHPGRVRDHNEDAFVVESPTSERARARGTLLVVSDGMGGHAAGEVASQIAVETIPAAYYRDRPGSRASQDSSPPVAETLVGAVLEANEAIFAEAERTPERQGMGCTVVAAVVQKSTLIVAHVGDSRAYLVHDGQIRQLTQDHSWVGQQVAAGILTPEQAEHHPRRSLLLQALGRESNVDVEVHEHALESGDVLVICSDGLTSVVRDPEIAERASRLPPRTATERLIALANERGAPDNVTVVVAAVGDEVTGPVAAVARQAAAREAATQHRPVPEPTTELHPVLGSVPPSSSPPSKVPPAAPEGPATDPAMAQAPQRPRRRGRLTPVSEQGSERPRRPLLPWILAAVSLLALIVLPLMIRSDIFTDLATSATPTAAPAPLRTAAPATVPPPIPTGLPGIAPAAPTSAPTAAASPAATSVPAATAAPATATTVPATSTPNPPATAAPTEPPTPQPTTAPAAPQIPTFNVPPAIATQIPEIPFPIPAVKRE
jgi:protein phosphatase